MKKIFEKCLWEELANLFGLERVKQLNSLDKLLDVSQQNIPTDIQKNLVRLNLLMIDNFWNWNEDELKMQFISPLLYMVDYNDSEKYHPFSQRPMQMKHGEIELSGVVEWILASGKQIPKEPFFFLHEYKKEQGTDNDPLGQLLAAMLTAQFHNENKNGTLYGCYIVGKDWYFVVLEGKKYQTTLAYNVTELPKLEQVFGILQNIKKII
jgi:hypothetical protein